jgi:hypothetical protein
MIELSRRATARVLNFPKDAPVAQLDRAPDF